MAFNIYDNNLVKLIANVSDKTDIYNKEFKNHHKSEEYSDEKILSIIKSKGESNSNNDSGKDTKDKKVSNYLSNPFRVLLFWPFMYLLIRGTILASFYGTVLNILMTKII